MTVKSGYECVVEDKDANTNPNKKFLTSAELESINVSMASGFISAEFGAARLVLAAGEADVCYINQYCDPFNRVILGRVYDRLLVDPDSAFEQSQSISETEFHHRKYFPSPMGVCFIELYQYRDGTEEFSVIVGPSSEVASFLLKPTDAYLDAIVNPDDLTLVRD